MTEKRCFQLEIYDRLRASEQAAGRHATPNGSARDTCAGQCCYCVHALFVMRSQLGAGSPIFGTDGQTDERVRRRPCGS